MADFHQTGAVPTLHRLKDRPLESLEEDLRRFTKRQPIALVLPALYSEFESEAIHQILDEISRVRYLNQVVVSLGLANQEQFLDVRRRLADLHPHARVIWNDGPRLQKIYAHLGQAHLGVGDNGKGRSCWIAYGYVLAGARSKIIALHDCDIVNYSRELLARLCYPVADLRLDFVFSKGYYARVTDRMHGRVTRLLVWPLVEALETVLGCNPFLRYLESFRYPLAGEFCMMADLARNNRIPGDWGLEVGVLAEVYRNYSAKRVCQVDLCDTYEHKHQSLSAEDPEKGLMRMTVDIAKTLFRTLAAEGAVLSGGVFRTVQAQYVRTAEDSLARYRADAIINGLEFDIHAEEEAVDAFAHGLRLAAESFLIDPLGAPPIPNWNRVTAAIPEIYSELEEAVELDNSVGEENLVGRAAHRGN
ncbi:MAG TPA: glycosyl transferase [Terriglobia bacterium]|nr:glycosyl transferase [Terriglobia bacterium]